MKKLLILSGKGGTGKTTTAAAFVRFSQAGAAGDCDVDAPNLHLVIPPAGTPETRPFLGGEKARIDPTRCSGCGRCIELCRFAAIQLEDRVCRVRDTACEGCGVCVWACPRQAAAMEPDTAGTLELYSGVPTFATAALKMGRGNSGKLVTEVKNTLFRAAPDSELVILDGSPGIGCPVISSISGADLVLVVAEPSRSGLSDLQRLTRTAAPLQARLAVCVNKWDTSPENAREIEDFCCSEHIPLLGRIPYDRAVPAAVNGGYSISEVDCPARNALWEIFVRVMELLALPSAAQPPVRRAR